MAQMEEFASQIFLTYDIPPTDSYRNAVAFMIQHLPPECTRVSLSRFGRSIHKARANQLAYGVIQEIRAKEKLREEEAAKKGEKDAARGEGSEAIATDSGGDPAP